MLSSLTGNYLFPKRIRNRDTPILVVIKTTFELRGSDGAKIQPISGTGFEIDADLVLLDSDRPRGVGAEGLCLKHSGFYQQGVSHEMQQVACRHNCPLPSAFIVGSWKTQCARWRSRASYLRGCTDDQGQAAMQKLLSCTLSRLSPFRPIAIVRVSRGLSGLHPIQLYGSGTGMTWRAFCCRLMTALLGTRQTDIAVAFNEVWSLGRAGHQSPKVRCR
jgi:hypothetical protein